MAPVIWLHHPAGQHGPSGFQALADGYEAELVEAAELGQVTVVEGSVRHVEVFPMGSVRTSIIGRPRPLPRHRRAATPGGTIYTPICDEPVIDLGILDCRTGLIEIRGGTSDQHLGAE
ncbi:hypothetical protein GCM10009791_04330 [Citricoccus zhacaiensis]